jgi:hypothetical protein
MRLKLGLLQDPAVIQRQIDKELREAELRRQKAAAPTVKTEAQTIADEEYLKKYKKEIGDHVKAASKPRIRPLSEAKAIETGANFISESFLFLVAAGLIAFESFRRDRKEKGKDADMQERVEALEKEKDELREIVQRLELAVRHEEPSEKGSSLQGKLSTLLDKKPFAAASKPTTPEAQAENTSSAKSATTVQASPAEHTSETASQPASPSATKVNATQPETPKSESSSWLGWLPKGTTGTSKPD